MQVRDVIACTNEFGLCSVGFGRVAYLKVLSQHMPGEAEENHTKPQPHMYYSARDLNQVYLED
jgi:hypothetical protein